MTGTKFLKNENLFQTSSLIKFNDLSPVSFTSFPILFMTSGLNPSLFPFLWTMFGTLIGLDVFYFAIAYPLFGSYPLFWSKEKSTVNKVSVKKAVKQSVVSCTWGTFLYLLIATLLTLPIYDNFLLFFLIVYTHAILLGVFSNFLFLNRGFSHS